MKKIYSLWLQGYDHAPEQVRVCLDRWSKLNPEYSLEILDYSRVKNILADFPADIADISHQSVSDIVRLALLKQTGGIWVDATVFPSKPLSEWIDKTVGDSEFFTYRRDVYHEDPKDRPISAWFLYARESSVMVEKLWKETCHYWSIRHYQMSEEDVKLYINDPISFMGLCNESPNAPYPYHWFQHIFAYLIKSDHEFSKLWDSCPYKSMSNPHQMQYWVREAFIRKDENILTDALIKSIIEGSEMQKLNWRFSFPIETMVKYSV